jgi:hypothetical protein
MTRKLPRRARGAALVLVPLVLAACSSTATRATGSGAAPAGPAASAAGLHREDTTVQSNLAAYLSKVAACKAEASPVVCVEAADRVLGGQVHDYANTLTAGGGDAARTADVTAARNSAQVLANSMEILGDAQPTQANYDQVLNTFNVNDAIASLQHAVAKVQADLG